MNDQSSAGWAISNVECGTLPQEDTESSLLYKQRDAITCANIADHPIEAMGLGHAYSETGREKTPNRTAGGLRVS